LRSVLCHPAGLPLAFFFFDKVAAEPSGGTRCEENPLEVFLPNNRSVRERFRQENQGATRFNGAFETGYRAWMLKKQQYDAEMQRWNNLSQNKRKALESKPKRLNEEDLTKLVTEQIEASLSRGAEAVHQLPVKCRPDSRGRARTDIVLRREDGVGEKKPLLLLMEVGLNCDWWQKAHQNIGYVNAMLLKIDPQEPTVFSDPMLFAVLTVSTQPKSAHDFGSAQLGVFLCVPAVNPVDDTRPKKFRLALMWRMRTDQLSVASSGIAKTLRAACLLPQLLKDLDRKSSDFAYLGPHCCRRGDLVGTLRALDRANAPVRQGFLTICLVPRLHLPPCRPLRAYAPSRTHRSTGRTTRASGTRIGVPTCTRRPFLLEAQGTNPPSRSCAELATVPTLLMILGKAMRLSAMSSCEIIGRDPAYGARTTPPR
jgi:hypothetical protein